MCNLKLKSGVEIYGVLWEPHWSDGRIIVIYAGAAHSIDLNNVVSGQCEVSYSRAERALFYQSQATVDLLSYALAHGWNPAA